MKQRFRAIERRESIRSGVCTRTGQPDPIANKEIVRDREFIGSSSISLSPSPSPHPSLFLPLSLCLDYIDAERDVRKVA